MSKGLAVVLTENSYECLELHYPRLRLIEAGYTVQGKRLDWRNGVNIIEVAGPEKGATYTSKEGYWAKSTCTFKEIDPKQVKILVIPGGYAPDRLRRYPDCNNLVAEVYKNGGVVGFICHAGWVPVSAKILKGKRCTCFFAIKDDLINAGAEYVDERCVVDGTLVSAQTPEDLPAFMAASSGSAQILKVAEGSK